MARVSYVRVETVQLGKQVRGAGAMALREGLRSSEQGRSGRAARGRPRVGGPPWSEGSWVAGCMRVVGWAGLGWGLPSLASFFSDWELRVSRGPEPGALDPDAPEHRGEGPDTKTESSSESLNQSEKVSADAVT